MSRAERPNSHVGRYLRIFILLGTALVDLSGKSTKYAATHLWQITWFHDRTTRRQCKRAAKSGWCQTPGSL